MLPISNIVLATDLSNCSKYAFQLARTIARDYEAKLVIVHVSPPPTVVVGEGIVPTQVMLVDDDALRKDLKKLVDEALLPKVGHCLLEGDPATEILRVAKDTKADLIIMGTHGRTGMGRLLMGSVAEQVLRRANCPVLTVKTPAPESKSTVE